MFWTWLERAGFLAVIVAAVIALLGFFETSQLPPRFLSMLDTELSPALAKLLIVLLGLFAIYIGLLRLRRIGQEVRRLKKAGTIDEEQMLEALNKSMLAVRTPIEQRLDALETRKLEEIDRRLGRLEQGPGHHAVTNKPVWFESQGFRWEILPNFKSQFRLHPPDGSNEAMLHLTLEHIFQGPYCPRACGLAVGDDLRANRLACSRCGAPLKPGVEIKTEEPRPGQTSPATHDPLWRLKLVAYRDAIAAIHEGKLVL